MLVFHGFLSAIPNGYYKRLRAAFGDAVSVVGVNYDYFDPAETIRRLDALRRSHLEGRRVVVFGNSLGGYWATVFAHRFPVEKLILVNPATRPVETLGRAVGATVSAARRRVEIMVTDEMVARYDAVPVAPDTPHRAPPTLVVLTRDDVLIDPTVAQRRYRDDPQAHTVVFDRGGHTIDLRTHPAMSPIAAFLGDDDSRSRPGTFPNDV